MPSGSLRAHDPPDDADDPVVETRGGAMRKAADEMDRELEVGEIRTRGEDWGGQVVRHIDLPPGADFTPLFEGLPGNLCQCPHWGYVVEGSIHVRYADGTEDLNRAGDLYYWPGGHTGWTDEGVVFIEFSPADEIRPVLDHVGAQLAPPATLASVGEGGDGNGLSGT
jgi:hypothetical protein